MTWTKFYSFSGIPSHNKHSTDNRANDYLHKTKLQCGQFSEINGKHTIPFLNISTTCYEVSANHGSIFQFVFSDHRKAVLLLLNFVKFYLDLPTSEFETRYRKRNNDLTITCKVLHAVHLQTFFQFLKTVLQLSMSADGNFL